MQDVRTDSILQKAALLLREQDIHGARAHLRSAIAEIPAEAALHAFAGLVACRSGDLEAGVADLTEALRLAPDDQSSRVNLVMALFELGRPGEAGAVAMAGKGDDPRLARARAYALHEDGNYRAAVDEYGRALAGFPADFESWNNLGNAHAALGEIDAAMRAFQRAMLLRPDSEAPRLNAARALGLSGRERERLALLREAVVQVPSSATLQYELGVAEAGLGDFERAEAALRAAITRDPHYLAAYNELGLLLEAYNRIDELAGVIAYAERQGLSEAQLAYLKAAELRRRGDFAAALPIAERIDPAVMPVRRHHLLGEIHDRLGNVEAAIEAFGAMNAAAAEVTPPALRVEAQDYLDQVERYAALTEPGRAVRWAEEPAEPDHSSPIFVVGFPRSGTTLTDTLLMGIPGAHVMEELSAMRAAEIRLAGTDRLPMLDAAEIADLRAHYFEQVMALSAPSPEALLVDKHPLHMARMPLIYRLFPKARVIFVQRHPCDVLLSCYFSSFQPNRAMVHFQTLESAARLYDRACKAWFGALAALPIDVHVLRYERLVADLEAEMRQTLNFLELPWSDALLDHASIAAKRGQIKTASYAQVTEPIYRRSVGRWQRYRQHLEPVLPLLAPWVERMGYSLDQ